MRCRGILDQSLVSEKGLQQALRDATTRRSFHAVVPKRPEAARQWSAACGIGGVAPDTDARLLSGPLASVHAISCELSRFVPPCDLLTGETPCCRFIRSDHVGINRLQFLLDSLTDLDKRCRRAACTHASTLASRRRNQVADSIHLM
jgi:hypothetical protein